MIDEKSFLAEVNRLIQAFGANAYGIEKTRRIKALVGHMPAKVLHEVVSIVIDNFRYAPTPSEIHTAAKDYLRAHPTVSEFIDMPRPCECLDCYETGWVYFDSEHGSSLMCCYCRHGGETWEQERGVVRWEKGKFDRVFGFVMKPFPLAKFQPNDDEKNRIFHRGDGDIVDWWKSERNKAREFWKALNAKMRGPA